jgi:outer membrane protein TolC
MGADAFAQSTKEVLRLSLQDAIQAGLANNLSVEIQRTSWQGTREAGTLGEEAAFEWNFGLSGGGGWRKTGSSTYSSVLIEDGVVNAQQDTSTFSNTRNITASVDKRFQWGGQFRFNYTPSYSGSSSETTYTLLEPPYSVIPGRSSSNLRPYSGSWSFSYSQELLRGFGRKVATASLVIARRGLLTADANFRRAVQDEVANIERVYWDLVNAQMNLANVRQSLEIAERNLRENKLRAEVGTIAPIQVTTAEATVARQEVSIIQAEASLLNAKDTFLRVVYSTTERPDDIVLTDVPSLTPISIEENAAIETAFNNRVELEIRRRELENAKLSEEVSQSNMRPSLSTSLSYNGSAMSAADFGGINGDIFAFRFPGYNLTLNFSMPLQNKSARASNIRARASRRSAELSLKDQELAITLEVRTAYRNLQAAEKSIAASEKSSILAQQQFDAEQTRSDSGLSTTYDVMLRQRDLDDALAAELNAKISYANAQTSLQRAMGTLLEHRNIKVQ